jgi:hypothetical protein
VMVMKGYSMNLFYKTLDKLQKKLELIVLAHDKSHSRWVESHYIKDVTDAYLQDPDRFDIPKDIQDWRKYQEEKNA